MDTTSLETTFRDTFLETRIIVHYCSLPDASQSLHLFVSIALSLCIHVIIFFLF